MPPPADLPIDAMLDEIERFSFTHLAFKRGTSIHRIGVLNGGQRLHTACGVQVFPQQVTSFWFYHPNIEESPDFCKKCKVSPRRLVLGQQLSI